MRTPFASFGTTIIDCCRCRAALGSVLPMTMSTLQRGRNPPDENHFVPLRTYSLPSRSMRSPMFVASDDAESGSVIENADRISPSSSGASQSRFTVSDPYALRISMLPVSGAEQFRASDANPTLPSCSEIGE